VLETNWGRGHLRNMHYEPGASRHEDSYHANARVERFADLAAQAGWSVSREWVSATPQFAIFSLVPQSSNLFTSTEGRTSIMETKSIKLPGPNHPITIEHNPARVTVSVAGQIIADTREMH
jgi:hypothetical protein